MAVKFQIQHVANSDVHDSKETLIPPLELALVENLDGDDG